MSDADPEPRFLNVRETAARLGVHENTIRNWARDGILRTARLPGTRYHRFDEREVERLREHRGAAVASVEPERRKIGPDLVDATDLVQWADTRDAQSRFPELVRRLLASTPGITNISVRAGDGVALPGWDGRADSTGASFLPSGRLWLEFGVGSNPKAKADADFEKRRDDPRGASPSESTFVFVTPRRWAGAATWVSEREAENVFSAVRVVDADDLEGWLQTVPAVHQWISEELGRRPSGAETLERWWARFRTQTVPELPPALFLAGREAHRDRLAEFFGEPPDVITVQASWRNDAIAFICATIDTLERPDLVQAPLLVATGEAWDQIVPQPGGMTLLPLFDEPDLASARAMGHYVVVPVGRDCVVRGRCIELPRPHRQGASDALQAAGIDFDKAYRLSGLARRSMPSLVRTLARDLRMSKPSWSQGSAAEILGPLSLLGGWTSGTDDQSVVHRTTTKPWEEVERELRCWIETDDPPFIRSGTQWHVASPEEAFLVLRPTLTTADLQRWQESAVEVLLELDPKLDLADEEKPMAGMLGVGRKYSSVLRRGIAEGIAVVGAAAGEEMADGSTGADHAATIVREILGRANADPTGQLWQSLSDILPLLSEAAPDVFLDAVHDDLDREEPVLRTMFQDGDASSWLYSSSPHTGLLWALENLCWPTESILRAALALARLQELDPGGRLSNRPLESLRSVLVGWIRHTAAPISLRVEVLDAVIRHTPEVAWPLLLGLWPETHATSSPPHSPRFRDWGPESRNVSVAEWIDYIGHIVERASGLADGDIDRWAQLAERLGQLPPSDRERLITSLDAVADVSSLESGARLMLWERIHTEVMRHRRFADAEWSMNDEPLTRLEAIASRLEPVANVERLAYLFDWHPDLADVDLFDHAAYEEKLLERRLDAIRQALAEGSLDALRKLADRSEVPSHLGWTLGMVVGDEHTTEILGWLDDEDAKLRDVAAAWASKKLDEKGSTWLRDVLTQSMMSTPDRRGAFVLQAPATREVWDTLDEIDPSLADSYWDGMNPWRVAPSDAEYAAERLLARDRAWAAVDLLSSVRHREKDDAAVVSAALVQAVLDAAIASDPATARTQSLGYEIGLLLDYLEAEGVDGQTLARYEFLFFRLLEHHRQPRALFAAMSDEVSLFIDLVQRVYRGKNDPKRESNDDEAALARHAWWVLHHWRDLPGRRREDGTVDGDHLAQWVRDARLAFAESDRADIGDEEIGRVLAASPPGADGAWPAEPVREIIDTIGSTSIEAGFHVGVVNDRGTTSRGVYDGGGQERALAHRYAEWAKQASAAWPRTSRVLRRLAESYERDARQMDERAQITADTE